MNYLLPTLAILTTLTLVSCTSQNPNELAPLHTLKPGVCSEGTLCNAQLTRDASAGVRQLMGGDKKVMKFVLQEPVGPVGAMAWREIWIYDPDGDKQMLVMTFREDGAGSADFSIEKMNK